MHASLHLRISQHQPVAQQKLYLSIYQYPKLSVALICRKHEPCVHLWIRQFISASWMLGRKPESNYSRDDIRSIQIPRAFQPPVLCAPFRLFGFVCDCKLARTYNYIPSLLPLPDSQGSTQMCPGTDFWLCRQIFRTWLDFPTFPRNRWSKGILCPIRSELVVNIPQASPPLSPN